MKKMLYLCGAAAILLASIASCADLGFGVDVDSGFSNPYWYDNGYVGDTYWYTPVWNYGPIYNPLPPAPPLIGNGPGSIAPSERPQRPRPPQAYPGINGIGWNPGVAGSVGGVERPGNGGRPSGIPTGKPVTAPTGKPIQPR